MANVKLSPFLQSVSGRLGKIVLYNIKGREYARVYVKPSNPDTESQRFIRKTFGSAVKSWQELSLSEKEKYNRKARRLSMSGYNLFISGFMKDNISREDTDAGHKNIFMASCKHSHSTMKACCSVPSSYFLKSSRDHSIMRVFNGSGAG